MPGDEESEAVGDCALTCGAVAQLLNSGASMDRRAALRMCAEDCRMAAFACGRRISDARCARCAHACLACAELCDRVSPAMSS